MPVAVGQGSSLNLQRSSNVLAALCRKLAPMDSRTASVLAKLGANAVKALFTKAIATVLRKEKDAPLSASDKKLAAAAADVAVERMIVPASFADVERFDSKVRAIRAKSGVDDSSPRHQGWSG
jgi:hypothetical protein